MGRLEDEMTKAVELGWFGIDAVKQRLLGVAPEIFPLHPTVIPVLVKLFSRFGQNERLKLADHSRHHDAIKTVQLALVQGKQLTGSYESPYESSPVKLRLHPYRLCLIKNAWYVIARPVDDALPRTYRVARFKSVRMLDDSADVPQDFSLRDYFGNAWAVFRGAESYDVEVLFTPDAARVVVETVWHHTQSATTHKDGSVTLKFRVDGLEEITNWAMSWTGRIKVVQPAALRDRVVERLKAALAMNEE